MSTAAFAPRTLADLLPVPTDSSRRVAREVALIGGFAVLTAIAFVARWGFRFRLVGVTSFTLLLAVSCWAFGVSYTPPVVVDGAVRAPIVFDNGNDLVVAQVPADLAPTTVQATLEQLEGNLRGSGRSSSTVLVRLRGIQPEGDGLGRPVILGEVSKTLR